VFNEHSIEFFALYQKKISHSDMLNIKASTLTRAESANSFEGGRGRRGSSSSSGFGEKKSSSRSKKAVFASK
jgi:hypothetical protein